MKWERRRANTFGCLSIRRCWPRYHISITFDKGLRSIEPKSGLQNPDLLPVKLRDRHPSNRLVMALGGYTSWLAANLGLG